MRVVVILLALWLVATASAESLSVGGVKRTYEIQLPDERPAPLVIVLHGNSEEGHTMREHTAWAEVARHEHFAVVFPNGLQKAWADMRSQDERASATPPARYQRHRVHRRTH